MWKKHASMSFYDVKLCTSSSIVKGKENTKLPKLSFSELELSEVETGSFLCVVRTQKQAIAEDRGVPNLFFLACSRQEPLATLF